MEIASGPSRQQFPSAEDHALAAKAAYFEGLGMSGH